MAFFVSSNIPPEYAARVTLLVGPPLADDEVTLNEVLVGQALLPAYAQLANTRPLLERAIARSEIEITADDLVPRVTTFVPGDQSVIEVIVSHGDPSVAADLANSIAAELVSYAQLENGSVGSSVTAVVIDPAVVPTIPESPRIIVNTAIAAAIGLIATFGITFLVENLRRDRDYESVAEAGPLRYR